MPDEDAYPSPEDFLRRMDAGELDRTFNEELKKISIEQLQEVANQLIQREADRGKPH